MKIVIDARIADPLSGGIGRYTHEILSRLSQARPQDLIMAVTSGSFNWPGIKILHSKDRARSPRAAFLLGKQLLTHKPDLTHFLHQYIPLTLPHPSIVTVHDRTPLILPIGDKRFLPHIWYTSKRWMEKELWWKRLARVDYVMSNSSATTRDLVSGVLVDPAKIMTIPLAADHVDSSVVDLGRLWWQQKPYVLIVGAAYPHKNFESLVSVYAELVREKVALPRLVHIGPQNQFTAALMTTANMFDLCDPINPHFISAGSVTDLALCAIMKQSVAVIHPAFYEGFSLQVAEAVRLGVPTIVGTVGSVPQVASGHGWYVNVFDRAGLKNILRTLLTGSMKKRPTIKDDCLIHTRSWDDVVSEISSSYDYVIAAHH